MASPLPPHWRYVPHPEWVEGDWVYLEDPATHTWNYAWRGTGPAPATMPAVPAAAPHGFAGTWPPTPPAPAAPPPAAAWPTPLPVAAPGPGLPGTPVTATAAPGAHVRATAHSRPGWLVPVLGGALALVLILLILSSLGFLRFSTSGYVGASAGNPGSAPGAGAGVSAGAGTGTGASAGAGGSANDGTASPVATTSASAQASAPAVAGPLGSSCSTTPVLPAHWAGMQIHSTANTVASRQELWAISHPSNGQPGAQLADYAGTEKVASSDMIEWVRDARCDGMSSAIEVAQFLNSQLGLHDLVQAVDSQPGLVAYVVGMNDLGVSSSNLADYSNAVGGVISKIRSVPSSKPVWCLIDKMTNSQAQAFKTAGCARVIVVYLPWQQSTRSDLQVSLIPEAGALAKSVDADNATGGVQTFSWWLDDPADAPSMGFNAQTGGLPPVSEVHRMGLLFKQGGAESELGITLEKSEDNFPRLGLCAAALRNVVGS